MDTFEIIYIITTSLAILALAGYNRMRGKDFREERELNNRRHDATSEALSNMALNLTEVAEMQANLAASLKGLEAKIAELPVDEIAEEVQRMSAWNDGFSEIVGFGKNVPKLNKEVLKHE